MKRAPDFDYALSEDHEQEILHALRSKSVKLPSDVDLEQVWHELRNIVQAFHRSRQQRSDMRGRRQRCQRALKHLEALAADLRAFKRETLWSDPDPLWPNRGLEALLEIKRWIESQLEFYRATDPDFRGTRDPNKKFLYCAVLRIWEEPLGQELRYSIARQKPPYGPLVRFLEAVLRPVLGNETPGPHGFAKIIDRKREIRRRKKG
jgi:hypothetical protein